MLDIGIFEVLVIGSLALIVVGPKELPGLLRTIGQFVAKARGMAREFQRTMDDAAREADLGDVADVVKGKGNLNKLPFDNQIVDSMKEFERSVKSEVADVKKATDTSDVLTDSDTPKPATAKADVSPEKAPDDPPKPAKTDPTPTTSESA